MYNGSENKREGDRMKKVGILIIICFLLAGCGNVEQGKYQTITPDEVRTLTTDLNVAIVDVRTIQEYASGHIENAMNIPLDKISTIEDTIQDKNKKIIVYCKTGVRSKEASEKLLKMGYTNVYDMKGLDSWEYELKK